MRNISLKLYKFMKGRYGPDELYKFTLIIYTILVIIDFFIDFYPLTITTLLLLMVIAYRFLSKNIVKRRKENQIYLNIKNKVSNYFGDIKRKYNNRNIKIYKKCPKCKTILRLDLPSKRGIKHVTCPKCHKRIAMLCLRREKVEVIVKKRSSDNKYVHN